MGAGCLGFSLNSLVSGRCCRIGPSLSVSGIAEHPRALYRAQVKCYIGSSLGSDTRIVVVRHFVFFCFAPALFLLFCFVFTSFLPRLLFLLSTCFGCPLASLIFAGGAWVGRCLSPRACRRLATRVVCSNVSWCSCTFVLMLPLCNIDKRASPKPTSWA